VIRLHAVWVQCRCSSSWLRTPASPMLRVLCCYDDLKGTAVVEEPAEGTANAFEIALANPAISSKAVKFDPLTGEVQELEAEIAAASFQNFGDGSQPGNTSNPDPGSRAFRLPDHFRLGITVDGVRHILEKRLCLQPPNYTSPASLGRYEERPEDFSEGHDLVEAIRRYLQETDNEQLSMAQVLHKTDKTGLDTYVGKANVMLCHWQGERVSSTLAAMQAYDRICPKEAPHRFFVDYFGVAHCKTADFTPEMVQELVSEIGTTVVVATPWNAPVALLRTWCIYEIGCTILARARLHVTLPPDAEESYNRESAEDTTALHTNRFKVDIEASEAQQSSDKQKILDYILDKPDMNERVAKAYAKAMGEYALDGSRHEEEELAEVLQQYDKVLRDVQEEYGEDGAEVGTVLQNLAGIHFGAGDMENALLRYEQALEVHRKARGSEHGIVMETLEAIAMVYTRVGKHQMAMARHNEVVRIRKKTLGLCHPEVGQSLHNLADAYKSQGKTEEALQKYREALAVNRKVHGNNHPAVATALCEIGLIHQNERDLDLALGYYAEALEIQRATLGNQHPSVGKTLNNIGALYQSQGKHEEALECSLASLAIKREVLGPSDPSMGQTLHNIGAALHAKGDWNGALEKYEEALALKRRCFGDGHVNVASTLANEAQVLSKKNRWTDALAKQQEAHSICVNALGQKHPKTVQALGALQSYQIVVANGLAPSAENLPSMERMTT